MNGQAMKRCLKVFGTVYLLMTTDLATAVTARITAEFVPSLDNPTNNVFTNTSAPGFFCGTMPAICDYHKSLIIQGRTANDNPFTANNPDPRQGLFFKLPADWRDITVRHAVTGETSQVQLRFTAIGGQLRMAPGATFATGIPDLTAAHSALWNGGGLEVAPAPCTSAYHSISSDAEVRFFWKVPVVAQCAKQMAFNHDLVQFYSLEVMYEISTPTPLGMSAGTWEADYSYTLGPGEDFDFGDNVRPSESRLDLKISLSVSHHLRVVFPPSADRLALEPEGGWMPWLSRGQRPERILRDQSFQFTSSGPVKMRVECQHAIGTHCAIENPAGHSVPVETRISLPIGMHAQAGGSVSKQLLSNNDDITALNDRYVANQTGTLHFEVKRSDVETMLAHQDTTYSGNVTVVWDSFLMP